MEGIDLSGASLRDPMFKNSTLKDADFANADLFNAVFDGVNDPPPSLLEAVARRFGFKLE